MIYIWLILLSLVVIYLVFNVKHLQEYVATLQSIVGNILERETEFLVNMQELVDMFNSAQANCEKITEKETKKKTKTTKKAKGE